MKPNTRERRVWSALPSSLSYDVNAREFTLMFALSLTLHIIKREERGTSGGTNKKHRWSTDGETEGKVNHRVGDRWNWFTRLFYCSFPSFVFAHRSIQDVNNKIEEKEPIVTDRKNPTLDYLVFISTRWYSQILGLRFVPLFLRLIPLRSIHLQSSVLSQLIRERKRTNGWKEVERWSERTQDPRKPSISCGQPSSCLVRLAHEGSVRSLLFIRFLTVPSFPYLS